MNYFIIKPNDTIKSVINEINNKKINFCVCLDEKKKLIGVFTLGDFRRAIIHKVNLNNKIKNFINKKYLFLNSKKNKKKIDYFFKTFNIENIPIIDQNKKLISIINKREFYNETFVSKNLVDNPVIIMAGGKGKRLDPFTKILPKPLIPIDNEPIIKRIIDLFNFQGFSNFHLVLKEKATIIKSYFHNYTYNYNIDFFVEKKPLGTAGYLRNFLNKFSKPIIVTNCDILINEFYEDILSFHVQNKNDMTLIAATVDFNIPYGVCEIITKGNLKNINEKPTLNFLVNAGFYIINPKLLNLIPKNKYFDMDQFIKLVLKKRKKIKVYPITQKNWIDVGQWDKYEKSIKKYKNLSEIILRRK